MPPSLVRRPLMPCPPLRTASGTSWVRGERQRVARPARPIAHLQHEPGRSAAHVRRAHPRIPGIARFDDGIGQRGRDGVVVDAGPPFGTDAQAADDRRAGRPPASPVRPRPPPAGRASPPRRTSAGVRGSSDPRMKVPMPSSSASGSSSRPMLGRTLRAIPRSAAGTAGDVEQAPDLPRIATDLGGRLVDHRVAGGEVARLQVAERGQPAVAPCVR